MLLRGERGLRGILVLSCGVAFLIQQDPHQTGTWLLQIFLVRFIGKGIRS